MGTTFNFGRFQAGKSAPSVVSSGVFRIALLGDFSGRAHRGERRSSDELARCKPLRLDVDTIDKVIASFGTTLRLPLGHPAESGVELRLGSLDDLHPTPSPQTSRSSPGWPACGSGWPIPGPSQPWRPRSGHGLPPRPPLRFRRAVAGPRQHAARGRQAQLSTDQEILLDQLIAASAGADGQASDPRLRAWNQGLRAWERDLPGRAG